MQKKHINLAIHDLPSQHSQRKFVNFLEKKLQL